MGLIDKLVAAVRGGTREVLELAVDANGLRILAQEIHECETAVGRAKQDLCRVTAERIRLQREADALQCAIEKKSHQAAIALSKGEDALAHEVAHWIADHEPLLADQRDKQQQLVSQEARLSQGLQAAIREIQDYRRELRMLKATASAHSATEKIISHSDTIGGRLDQMQGSLQRIKLRQQDFADTLEATRHVNARFTSRALDQRLTAMERGGKKGADVVLERIRDSLPASGHTDPRLLAGT